MIIIEFDKDNCPYSSVCKLYGIHGECNQGCIRYVEFMSLLESSKIPKAWYKPKQLVPEEQDIDTFYKLNDFKKDIESNIENGKNLYLYSSNVGNGKSSWAIKIMLAYFDKIWSGNGLKTRGVFLSVPQFITEIRDNITLQEEEILRDKEIYKEIDLLILDDIGAVKKTDYIMEQLFNIIDYRVISGKTTLYTSNISPNNLAEATGKRLASRILANAEILEIKGGDNRW